MYSDISTGISKETIYKVFLDRYNQILHTDIVNFIHIIIDKTVPSTIGYKIRSHIPYSWEICKRLKLTYGLTLLLDLYNKEAPKDIITQEIINIPIPYSDYIFLINGVHKIGVNTLLSNHVQFIELQHLMYARVTTSFHSKLYFVILYKTGPLANTWSITTKSPSAGGGMHQQEGAVYLTIEDMDKLIELVKDYPEYLQNVISKTHELYKESTASLVPTPLEPHELSSASTFLLKKRLSIEIKMLEPSALIAILAYLLQYQGQEQLVRASSFNMHVGLPIDALYNEIIKLYNKKIRQVENLEQQVLAFKLVFVDMQNRLSVITNSTNTFKIIDDHNSMNRFYLMRRITSELNTLNANAITSESRSALPSYYGRLCCLDSPEGESLGLLSSLPLDAGIGYYGVILSKLYIIKEDKVTDEFVLADIFDEPLYTITDTYSYNSGQIYIIAKVDYRFIYIHRSKITHVLRAKGLFSIAANSIPLLNHIDAARSLMACAHIKQAVQLLYPEHPYIFAGQQMLCPPMTPISHSLSWTTDARLSTLSSTAPSTSSIIFSKEYDPKFFLTGSNLSIIFMMWRGYTFEDAVVVSDRLIQRDKLTSIHIHKVVVPIYHTEEGPEMLNRNMVSYKYPDIDNIDSNGIIKKGSLVSKQSILVAKVRPLAKSQRKSDENLLAVLFEDISLANVRDSSYTLEQDISGIVSKVEVDAITNKNKNTLQQYHKSGLDELKNKYTQQLGYIFDFYHNNIKKLNVSREAFIAQVFNNTFMEQNEDEHDNLKNQLIGLMDRYKADHDTISLSPPIVDNTIALITISILQKRPIKIGDKLSGQHGNKGICSYIARETDMPVDINGNTPDLILSVLNVFARMNLAQINIAEMGSILARIERIRYEHKYLGIDRRVILSKVSHILNFDVLSNSIHVYISKDKPMDYTLINSLADVLNISYKIKYYDVFSDAFIAAPITSGILYMYKLNHLAEDKINARSVGPYNLITQQPIRGKARRGAQRIGEMERCAIQAYGANNVVYEMFSVKSDDVIGRKKTIQALLSGVDLLLYNRVFESFKLVQSYLKAMLINLVNTDEYQAQS